MRDHICSICGKQIKASFMPREQSTDENLALDLLSMPEIEEENGC